MRIKSLTLENFRSFQGETTIDLSADVIAIYGRNGVGKTTIFDAIEFCLLGELVRLGRGADLSDCLPNVRLQKPARVTLCLQGGNLSSVQATIGHSCPLEVMVNQASVNHRDLLYDFLVTNDFQPPRREVAPLQDLFRSTVLLSHASVRSFVDAFPADRSRLLTNMVGAAHLQRCLEKAQQVATLAARKLKDGMSQAVPLRETLQEVNSELTARDLHKKELLDRLGGVLVEKSVLVNAVNATGISVDISSEAEQDDEALVPVVASACRESRAELARKMHLLAETEGSMNGHAQRMLQRDELTRRCRELQDNLRELTERENEARKKLSVAQFKVYMLNESMRKVRDSISALDALPGLQLERRTAEREVKEAMDRREEFRTGLEKFRENLDALCSKLPGIEADVSRARDSTERLSETARQIEGLRDSLPDYSQEAGRLSQNEAEMETLDEEAIGLDARARTLREQRSVLVERKAEANGQQSLFCEQMDRKNELIARLREFATGLQCPFCGKQHESREALTAAIDQQLSQVPEEILRAIKETERVEAELRIVDVELGATGGRLSRCEERKRELVEKRQVTTQIILDYNERAHAYGAVMDREKLEKTLFSLRSSLANEQEGLRDSESLLSEVRKRRDRTTQEIEQHAQLIAAQEEIIASRHQQLDEIEQAILNLGLSAAAHWEPEAITQHRMNCAAKLERQAAEHESARGVTEVAQSAFSAIQEQRQNADEMVHELEKRLTAVIQQVDRSTDGLRRLGLDEDADEKQVAALRRTLEARSAALDKAENVASKYQWSCEVARLEHEVQARHEQRVNLAGQLESIKQTQMRLENAQKLVESWCNVLTKEKDDCVELRIRKHQPEILNLFKAMVPSPHLFENLNMERRSDGLHLAIQYRDQVQGHSEPRFFLSESQANVMALAIFLSLARDQNWSQLRVILMDDPVQHLDDLDAVAFLDTLRSIVLSRSRRTEQVILSTCDLNLYLLMIRKYRLLEGEGLRFRAMSLLENGTEAPKVVYDVGDPDASSALATAG